MTHSKSSDECGIVVVGARTQGPAQSWRATVLADLSFKPKSPNDWARRAIAAMQEFHADRLVAEVNQGGDMVKTIIATLDPLIPLIRAPMSPINLSIPKARKAPCRAIPTGGVMS